MEASTTTQSRAHFPVFYAGALVQDKPDYLLDQQADWMHGTVQPVARRAAARTELAP